MDIRTDHVRSLSSACFSLKVRFESDEGKCTTMHLAVSSGVCFSADGDMKADVIYLYPEQNNEDIIVGEKSIYSATDLDELCNLLFEAAIIKGWHNTAAEYDVYWEKINGHTFAIAGRTNHYSHKKLTEYIENNGGRVSKEISSEIDYLICNDQESATRKAAKARLLGIPFISELDFICGLFGNNLCGECQEEYENDGITVSVADIAPITIANFKKACIEAGITLENLKSIIVQNNKFGTHDSAMFIPGDNIKFAAYKERYNGASDGQKPLIAEEFIDYVRNDPVLEVRDNEFELPGTMTCVWNSSNEALVKSMTAFLEGNSPGYWMGTYSMEFTINIDDRTLVSREVLFYGDI